MTEYLTYRTFRTEDFGLLGIPKHLTDFKLEVSANDDQHFALVTCTFHVDKSMLEKATKRYRLVEVEDTDENQT